jgi:phosphopantothenate-cysteine ligase
MVDSEHQVKILSVLRTYNEAKRNNKLLLLPFTTIIDYLHELYVHFPEKNPPIRLIKP